MNSIKGIVLVPSDFNGVDWVAKIASSGLNTLGMHSGGGQAHNVYRELKFMGEEAFREKLRNAGLNYEYEIHASDVMIDHSLCETHPEYFPKFFRTREIITDGNWCVSNPVALKMVVDNSIELAKRLPSSTHRYFFWGVDRLHQDWCHCEKCSAYSGADQALITANAIAERITEADPEGQVCFLAYNGTFSGPRRIKPHDRVFLEFAPYFRCYFHALTDENCAINVRDREVLEHLLETFSPEKTHILEYWLDSSLFGFAHHPPYRPVFIPEVVEEDIRYYTSLGIRSITTFAVRQDEEFMKAHGDADFRNYAEIINRYL